MRSFITANLMRDLLDGKRVTLGTYKSKQDGRVVEVTQLVPGSRQLHVIFQVCVEQVDGGASMTAVTFLKRYEFCAMQIGG